MSELTPEEEAEVRGLLAALPDPELPGDVQDRITSAVAANAAVAPAASVAPATILTPRPPHRRRTRLLETAAVLVVLATIAAVVVGYVNRDDGTPPTNADLALSQPTAGPITASGFDYTPTTIDAKVRGLVAGTVASAGPSAASTSGGLEVKSGTGTASSSAAGTAALTKLVNDATARQACIDQLASVPGAKQVAIDVGRWQGKPAAVIVLPDENDTDKVDAWVVGPTCSDADDPFPYRYERVTRP